jgi:carboxylate-amine ligase
VGIPDRDLAVAVAQRVTRWLPLLLALSASSPYWRGDDTGYASTRSLLWQRWPTAGASGLVRSADDHEALVAELISSGTITDRAMIYFDVRPSAHAPTLELRITDACPDVDDVVMLAGLFRALVHRERDAVLGGTPLMRVRGPVLRAATWRAARSGLEGELVDLSDVARPVPAADAVRGFTDGLRDHLEAHNDWAVVSALVDRALRRGSPADWQRRVLRRRGRLADVVDALLTTTRVDDGADAAAGRDGQPLLAGYRTRVRRIRPAPAEAGDGRFCGDEVVAADDSVHPHYAAMTRLFDDLGADALRDRERTRDAEQRANGMTFRVSGEAKARLFPIDIVPRIVDRTDWTTLCAGLTQRARALDAFLHDVYDDRQIVHDGVIPAAVIDRAPGLLPLAALVRQRVRVHVAGMDLVHAADGHWCVLEDNLRIPSGLGYAMANRELSDHVWPDLDRPAGLLGVDDVPALLRTTLETAAPPATPDEPTVIVLSEGPGDSAWFEHQLLAEAMDVPLAHAGDLVVRDRTVYLRRHGARRQVDVIYLRIDEDDLVHASGADGRPLGPSLLSAVASGTVTLANAPGNGIGDDKAVYAFVGDMIRYYLGERPLLAPVPTYLCGDPDQRAHVLDRLGALVLKPVDGYGGEGVLIGPFADDEEIETVRRQVVAAPHRWIAQEMVRLSTHPTFDGGRLTPRHVDLRAFVLHGDEVRVAPAALTRVAPEGSLVVNSSRGGGAKDTWILG